MYFKKYVFLINSNKNYVHKNNTFRYILHQNVVVFEHHSINIGYRIYWLGVLGLSIY